MKTPLLFLSARDVQRALPMPKAIEAMRDAFAQLSRGEVTLPTRESLSATDEHGVALVMPCHSSSQKHFSVKVSTVFHQNPSRGIPAIHSLLTLTDDATGQHVALLEGASLTAIRTGAASGLATDLLARKDASIVAMIGAGVQARTQLEAVCCVRPIRQAFVYSRTTAGAQQFADEMADRLDVPVEVSRSAADAIAEADVVCTATNSTTPVFDDQDLPVGTHINGVGSYRLDMLEVPASTVCRSRVFVDHKASSLAEAGDLVGPVQQGLIPESHVSTELGDVILGNAQGRQDERDVTFFKSVGVAIQDLCAAAHALREARRIDAGVELDLT